jgi:hypothetical protein
VLFAFRNAETEIETGKELNEFQVQTIEANLSLDPSMFAPPAMHRTPAQNLMDQLFLEREDSIAVLWTYHDFKAAYPQVDSDIPMQVIGYQILKMGDKASAVVLLERNAADYPKSSGAAFGLGRAYGTVDRAEDAKREYRRALSLDANNKRAKSALAELSKAD